MAIKFLVENNALVLSPEVLVHTPFRHLFEHNPANNGIAGLRDLLWVKFMYEEDGDYSQYEPGDKLAAVNLNVYAVINPVLGAERVRLRDAAAKHFRDLNETIEGRIIKQLDQQIMRISDVMEKQNDDIDNLKDKALTNYIDNMTSQSDSLFKLIKSKNDIEKQAEARGGKKKVRNKADTVTTPNEAGTFSIENIVKRKQLRDESNGEAHPTLDQGGRDIYTDAV